MCFNWFRELLTGEEVEEVVVNNDGPLHNSYANVSDQLRSLWLSRKKIRNIKFYGVSIVDRDKVTIFKLFDKHGGSIRSLAFDGCYFDADLFRGIMKRCTALRNVMLSFSTSNTEVQQDIIHLKTNSTTFDKVVELTLKTVVDSEPLVILDPEHVFVTSPTFFQFLQLFPKLKRLHLKVKVDDSRYEVIFDAIVFANRSQLLSIYDQILALRNQLEELELEVCIDLRESPMYITLESLGEMIQTWNAGNYPGDWDSYYCWSSCLRWYYTTNNLRELCQN